MAGRQQPSFLKRQKEQARLARANEKREAKRARRLAKSDAQSEQEPESMTTDEATGADDTADMDEPRAADA
jgi:hypothetical protein